MTTQTLDVGTVSRSKYHSLWRGNALGVALEVEILSDPPMTVLDEQLNKPHLTFVSPQAPDKLYVYHPAVADGDLTIKATGDIWFVNWADLSTAQAWRLVLRVRSSHKTNSIKAVYQLAGESEVQTFRFAAKDGCPARDGYRKVRFTPGPDVNIPVHIKLRDDRGVCYIGLVLESQGHGLHLRTCRLQKHEVFAELAATAI